MAAESATRIRILGSELESAVNGPHKTKKGAKLGRFYGQRDPLTRSPESLPWVRCPGHLAVGHKFCRISQRIPKLRSPYRRSWPIDPVTFIHL